MVPATHTPARVKKVSWITNNADHSLVSFLGKPVYLLFPGLPLYATWLINILLVKECCLLTCDHVGLVSIIKFIILVFFFSF